MAINYQKLRSFLFIFLVIADVVLLVLGYIFDFEKDQLVNLIEIFISVTIALLAYSFIERLHYYQLLVKKRDYISNISPVCYVFYDTRSKKTIVPEFTRRILNIPEREKYDISDFKYLIGDTDLEFLKSQLKKADGTLVFDKDGTSEVNNENGQKFYKYTIQYLNNKKAKMQGIIIWFIDFTASIKSERKLVTLLKKFRLYAFELETLFNNLPFALWRRSSEGLLTYQNDNFDKLFKTRDYEEFKEGLDRISKVAMNEKRPVQITKTIVGNHHLSINEHPIPREYGTVGFSIDITKWEEAEKRFRAVNESFDYVLELSSNGVIILDKKLEVLQFNTAFTELSGIGHAFLSSSPAYGAVLDKMRENNKMPEVQDYKHYKEKLLSRLKTLTENTQDFFHLSGGVTIKIVMTPAKAGNIILTFENITDVLTMERSYNEVMLTNRAIVEAISVPAAILGANGSIKFFNTKFAKLFNIAGTGQMHYSDVLLGINLEEQIKEQLRAAIIEGIESRKAVNVENATGGIKSFVINPLPDNSVFLSLNVG